MTILDDRGATLACDRGGMHRHLEAFPLQLREALDIGRGAPLTLSASGVRSIVVAGMGGSAIGAEIAAGYLAGAIGVPFHVVRNYDVPAFVGPDAVVVAASYSGNTEETLAAYRAAHARGARLACITTGGELGRLAAANGHDLVRIPSGLPPRAALGYSLVPLLVLLGRLGIAPDPEADIADAIAVSRECVSMYGLGVPFDGNPAKELAAWLRDGLPVIYGTPRTAAVATRWCGQLAENAKVLAHRHELPELDHNEIVGWSGARPFGGRARVVFLHDEDDHPRNELRAAVTRQEVEAAGAAARDVRGFGRQALGRLLSLIMLGDFVSLYLAVLGGVDPTPVEPIDRLKKALAEA
jgi:glucose/mannose-6-phosphate isomerase